MEVTIDFLEKIKKEKFKYVFKVPYKNSIVKGMFYGFVTRQKEKYLKFWNLEKEDYKGTQSFFTVPLNTELELIGQEGTLEVRLLHYPQNNDGTIKRDKYCDYNPSESKQLKKIQKLSEDKKNEEKVKKEWEKFKKSEEYKYFKETVPDDFEFEPVPIVACSSC